ncbi:MAG: preprotein translocase subunit YajC [Dactylosporangium sp.]|nr:preprotein translocase subunit YajC [Dactylosporangium sp.]NNJ60468.1 preprotein translocase subunit YajC [Dactylosporangium sp.]
MLALLFAVLYFLMIRPQQRRSRRLAEMQASIGVGDEVVTVGGLYGTIQSVDDETVMLEITPEVVARYARASISRVVVSAADADEDFEDEDEDFEDGDSTEDGDDDTADQTVKPS